MCLLSVSVKILALISMLLRAGPPSGSRSGGNSSRPGIFSGGGHTLGGDEVESTFIPDPDAPQGTRMFIFN